MGDTDGLNFETWLRPFRDAMTQWQHLAAPPFAGFNPAGFNPASFNPSGFVPGAGFGGMSGFASAQPFGNASGPFTALFEQLSTLAQGQWQQLAARLASGANTDATLASWRGALESLTPMLGAAQSLGSLRPGLDASALREVLSTPQVGPMREHLERWQKAMLAQLDHQDAARAFSAQLADIMKRALEQFGQRMTTRHEAGKAPATMREVFDEWIEAGEAAWAERASDDAFVAALGAYTNTQLRVRAAQADQINRIAEHLGLPTRQEVDADHRRIAQLEREVRRLQREACAQGQRAAQGAGVTKNPAPTVVAERTKSVKKSPSPAKAKAKAKAKAAASKPAHAARTASAPKAARTQPSPPATVSRVATKSASKPVTPRGAKAFPMVAAPRAIGKPTRATSTRSHTRTTP
ncbi:MAG: hypothetical protein KDI69_00960 [Xanthomonadales bacterium]|nr:hypothetical protein [Xanthomonadales bacterium]